MSEIQKQSIETVTELSPKAVSALLQDIQTRVLGEKHIFIPIYSVAEGPPRYSIWGRVFAATVLASDIEPHIAVKLLRMYNVILTRGTIVDYRYNPKNFPPEDRFGSRWIQRSEREVGIEIVSELQRLANAVVAMHGNRTFGPKQKKTSNVERTVMPTVNQRVLGSVANFRQALETDRILATAIYNIIIDPDLSFQDIEDQLKIPANRFSAFMNSYVGPKGERLKSRQDFLEYLRHHHINLQNEHT